MHVVLFVNLILLVILLFKVAIMQYSIYYVFKIRSIEVWKLVDIVIEQLITLKMSKQTISISFIIWSCWLFFLFLIFCLYFIVFFPDFTHVGKNANNGKNSQLKDNGSSKGSSDDFNNVIFWGYGLADHFCKEFLLDVT